MPEYVHRFPALLSLLFVSSSLLVACGDDGGDNDDSVGTFPTSATFSTSEDMSTESGGATMGDGDGDSSGDGDADTSASGDGDGDGSTSNSGDGDGDGSTSNSGDGDGEGDGECFEVDLDMGVVPPNILFVIDKSSSMTMTWDDGGVNTPRWNSLRGVVESLTDTLDQHVNFGLKVYPRLDAGFGECGVDPGADVGFALGNGAQILAALPPNNAPLQGNTPTQPGVVAAIDYLDSVYDADPDTTPAQAIILIADGGIGCNGSSGQTASAIADAFAQSPNSIATYVVGIDISAFVDDEMNAYAQAGGHPLGGNNDFYQTGNAQQLANSLADVVSDIQACQVPLDPQPTPSVSIEVRVDGELLPELDAPCGDAPGYVIEEVDGLQTLVFCGPSCEAVKLSGTANVQYFCEVG